MTQQSGDPARVRIADVSDEEELMALCRQQHRENGILPLSEGKVRATLLQALIVPTPPDFRRGVVGVIGAPGSIEAAIYLKFTQGWYTDQWQFTELFNYVLPEFRGSSNSRDLIAFGKEMSKYCDLWMAISVVSTHRTEAKVRHYRQVLGEPVGALFMYRPHVQERAN